MRPATKLGPDLGASHAPGLAAHARRLAAAVALDDPIEDAYPLSPVQEAMLFHTVGSDAADLYIVQQRLELDGPLDVESFRRAWALVIARHPALRSVFAWSQPGPPLQVVCRQVDVPVELIDLSKVEAPEAAIEHAFASDRTTRFDLTMPPLMRLTLFRLEEQRHVLLWTQHHLLQDGWSSSVVLNEVFAAHELLRRGAEPALGAVRPFREFIDWLGREGDRDSGTFWKRHLAGFSEPTRMGAEGAANRSAETYTRRFLALTPELTADLRRFARKQRVSLNTVLVGGLAIVLSRHTGRADVAFGTVASGRPPALPGVESMVGMFINTLVLRLEVDFEASIGEWLPTVQARQATLFDHEHSALPQVQSWSELPPGTALTDVLFAYWNFGGAGTSPDGTLTYRTVDGYGRTSFPFSVTVEGSDPINLGVDFDGADVAPARAEQFLAHYATILASIVADVEAPIATLPMLTTAERRAIDEFNATASPVPYDTVLDAFAAQVAKTPDAAAAECDGATVTYAELDRRSRALAQWLLRSSHGAVPRVAIFLERSIEMLVAVWGTLRAGGAFVPIDRHHPPERIGILVADGRADVVVTTSELAPLLADLDVPSVALPLADDSSHLGDDALAEVVPGDLAYVMFTSGSTGRPKGVMIEHRSLINYVWWAAQTYGNGEPTTFPLYSSVAFDLTVTSMFVPLITGGKIVVYPDRQARDLSVLDVFAEDRVDVVKLTPSHLAVLEPHHLATSQIRTLILGGEDLSPSLAADTVSAANGNLAVYNEYGPTEATVGCMIHRFDPAIDVTGSVPIGRPVANTRIYLLDEGLSPVPTGAVGELYIAGDGVALGYLNNPELTAERFVPDPFVPEAVMYRSGDQARRNERGLLEYVGRSDEQVKVRGYRLEPGEIEAVLARHPTVSEAAVAIRRPRPDDVRLVAYYVTAPGAAANVTELRGHLAAHLPAYMVPSHLVRIDAVPVTPNGKLDRDALPETIGESVTSAHHVDPRNDAERLVADLAAELLGVERVSMADNFFDLGGHSVLAMQLIARLHDEAGIRISPRVVLLNTLAQAAAQLPGGGDETTATPVATTETVPSMATSAFFFGPSGEALFGLRHTPAGERTRHHSVLICPPVGWEFMRTHRALRSLGRRLGLEGFTVLRFDYFATGDSFGSDGSGSIARWIDDVAAAAAELRADDDGDLTVIGMRLGAALAVAAAAGEIGIDRLVLWDPVVRGAGHLAILKRMHAEMLANRTGVIREMLGDELLGFRYPDGLRSELGAFDLAAMPWPEVPTTVLCSRPSAEFAALSSVTPTPPEVKVIEDAGAWDDLSSAQAALLPSAIPQRIVELLKGVSP